MLSISALTIRRSAAITLAFPDITLKKGENAVIIGPSGCGKTSLLQAIAGLITPEKGSITLEGKVITSLPQGARDSVRGEKIGIILQNFHLVKQLTVLDNLLLAPYMAGNAAKAAEKKAEAEALLNTLGLADKADAKPEQLSQGQAQRVAIARAILGHPALILADEPTSSLNDAACETVIRLLLEQAARCNASLLVVTHDARVTKHFSTIIPLAA